MKFVCVIEEAIKDTVNADILSMYPAAGPDSFSAPYSTDGLEPITHYITSWRVSSARKDELVTYFVANWTGQFTADYVEYEEVDDVIAGWGMVAIGI